MSRHLTLRRLLLVALPLLTAGFPAHAFSNRVFAAARTGNDANICGNVATPCQSFAGALSQVNPDGEIIVLESGGYGPMVINQAVRISAPAGIVAFIHPPSGDAVTINASTATVVLRGLTLNSGTGYGIKVFSVGKLFIERCTITSFGQDGIFFQVGPGKLLLRDVDVFDSGNAGVNVAAGSAVIRGGMFSNNVNAGVLASNGSSVAVIHATAAGNAIGFLADNNASMMLDGVQAVSNTDKGFSAVSATLRFVNSVASQNNTGVANTGGGTLIGSLPGTSVVSGNSSSEGSPNGTAMTLK